MSDKKLPDNFDSFDKELYNYLQSIKFSLKELHGDIFLDEWYKDKTRGPIILLVNAELLQDDYELNFEIDYPQSHLFSFYLSEQEHSYYALIVTHSQFDSVLLFGEIMSTKQFNDFLVESQGKLRTNE